MIKKWLFLILLIVFFLNLLIRINIHKAPTDIQDIQDIQNIQIVFHAQKFNHEASKLSDSALFTLERLYDATEFKKILNPILVERVPGTESHGKVKQYIVSEMRKLNWSVELDNFHALTPNKGRIQFSNIIATLQPEAARFLVLACHYDSKLMKFVFIGATDSAVPCAMMIYLAKQLHTSFLALNSAQQQQQQQQYVSLKFIFFDGEEAFVNWTEEDSLYGSRHLASAMESKQYLVNDINTINELHRIDLLVLLDLFGGASPRFHNFFAESSRWYESLADIEKRFRANGLFKKDGSLKYFSTLKHYSAGIQDDHLPFLNKGVPILHLIPVPFPDVWHTQYDNEEAINYETVNNLILLMETFVLQYVNGSVNHLSISNHHNKF